MLNSKISAKPSPAPSFDSKYSQQDKELLVLTSDHPSGASKRSGDSVWTASKFFLAYIDLGTNELKAGDGRIVWPATDAEKASGDKKYKSGCIYRLKVRELLDKAVPKGMVPSFFNQFWVTEVLDEGLSHDALLAIWAEHLKPVKLTDTVMGEFGLDKNLSMFNGELIWLGKKISVSLDVDVDNKAIWTKALKVLRTLFEQQKQHDLEFRALAAKKLVRLANEWSHSENINAAAILPQDFIKRIKLSSLSVTSRGAYTAYYDDDNLFFGHVISVYGSLKAGVKSADIEG